MCAGCSDADVGTEVLAIGGNRGEGLGRSLKQQSIDLGLVLVGHRADRGRKCEHHRNTAPAEARLPAPQAMPSQSTKY